MEQQAYDFSLFEAKAPHKRQKAQLRAVEGGKTPGSALHRLAVNARHILAAVLFLGLTLSLLQSKVALTELTAKTQKRQSELTTAQSTYNYLTNELNNRTNLANVEEVAAKLGLMKVDDSQITYMRLEDTGVIIRKESAVTQWTQLLHSGALTLMEYFDF